MTGLLHYNPIFAAYAGCPPVASSNPLSTSYDGSIGLRRSLSGKENPHFSRNDLGLLCSHPIFAAYAKNVVILSILYWSVISLLSFCYSFYRFLYAHTHFDVYMALRFYLFVRYFLLFYI